MKCKNWEKRNRGPVLVVTANHALSDMDADRLGRILGEQTGCKNVAVLHTTGEMDLRLFHIDPREPVARG